MISIGPINDSDLETVLALLSVQMREHAIETATEDLRKTLRTVIDTPAWGFVLVARDDGIVVGFAYVSTILSFEHGGHSGWLEELYIDPQWRSDGVGSRLIDEVLLHAQQRGLKAIDLEVDKAHERVIGLYLRRGFRPVPRARFVRAPSAATHAEP